MSDYLTKPLEMTALEAALNRWARRKAKQRAAGSGQL